MKKVNLSKEKAPELTEASSVKKRRICYRNVDDVKSEIISEFNKAFCKYVEQYENPQWSISGKIGSSSTYSLRLNEEKKAKLIIDIKIGTINCD